MLAELLPMFDQLTREQKWLLMEEIQQRLYAEEGDVTIKEPLKSEIAAALERQHQAYLEHPESAIPWEEVSRRMRASRPRVVKSD